MRATLILVFAATASIANAQVSDASSDVAVYTEGDDRCLALASLPTWTPQLFGTQSAGVTPQNPCAPPQSPTVLPEGFRFDLRPLPPGPDESLGRTVLREQRLDQLRQQTALALLHPDLNVADRPSPIDLTGHRP